MYAVIRTGGKQYKVAAGDLLKVDKLEVEVGKEFDLSDVLYIGGDKSYIGKPVLEKAKVTAVITQQTKAPKILVFKKKRRQGYRRTQGHRQLTTELFIQSITTPDGDVIKADTKPSIKVEKAAK